MNALSRNVSIGLAYGGTIPFWIFVLVPETVVEPSTASMFVAYGAIIASFMAGSLWGQLQATRSDLAVLVASNALALISFATLILPRPLLSIALQLPLFWLLLAADYRICVGDVGRRWYPRLRLRVTLMVTLAYGVVLLKAYFHPTIGNGV